MPDPIPASAPRSLRRRFLVDTTPLRQHREFRLLWVGQSVTFLGSMITYVALPYQVYELTKSSWRVGLLGLVEFGAMISTALIGGALADAVDRRRMVRWTELSMLLASGILLLNATLDDPSLVLLFVMAGAITVCDALQRPSLDSLMPRLVPRDQLLAASALDGFRMNVGMIAGPALGGLLIATVGLPWTFAFDMLTFTLSLLALQLMRAVPPPPEAESPSLKGILDGLRYARSRPELMGTYLVDINATFFGIPTALYPALAAGFGGAGALGLLYSAPAVGALVASLTSGWTIRIHHHGQAVLWAAGLWGVAILAFGLSPWLWLALLCLAAAGAADMVSGLFRMTIWNTTIPDHLRGRLAGIEMVGYSTGPTLGNVEAGAMAALSSPRFSVGFGGVMCVLGTLALALALPEFRRYDARELAPH